MKIPLIIALFFSITASAGELEFVPMASFTVKVSNSQESDAAWNKIRVFLLSNNYKFFKNQSATKKIYSYPDVNEKITVLISNNHSNGFVEVVFFQDRKTGFSKFAENKYVELRSGIKKVIVDNEVVDGVPLVPAKNGN
jgi:hypothetical protein